MLNLLYKNISLFGFLLFLDIEMVCHRVLPSNFCEISVRNQIAERYVASGIYYLRPIGGSTSR